MVLFLKLTFCIFCIWGEAHFYKIQTKTRARTSASFKLDKIEKHNIRVGRNSADYIPYKAAWVRLPDDEVPGEMRKQRSLEFTFLRLNPKQFKTVKSLYGNISQSKAKKGVHNYDLVDFMPPFVQATYGHAFKAHGEKIPEIECGRNKVWNPDDRANNILGTGAHTQIYTNCWGTSYEFIRTLKSTQLPKKINIFGADEINMKHFLMSRGRKIFNANLKKDSKFKKNDFSNTKLGDVVIVMPRFQFLKNLDIGANGSVISSEKGNRKNILEHTAVIIDKGYAGDPLVFEKSDAGDLNPYRLIPLSESIRPYSKKKQTRIHIRRYRRAFPDPRKTFGGYKSAVKPAYKRPLEGDLKENLLLIKEYLLPSENQYLNRWTVIKDVPIIPGKKSGRYRLHPKAYKAKTFDFRQFTKPCKPSSKKRLIRTQSPAVR